MKWMKYISILMTTLVMVACSGDDKKMQSPTKKEVYYLSVKLKATDGLTRAPEEFEEGTEEESAINISKAKFYFYDDLGGYLASGSIENEDEDSEFLEFDDSNVGNIENRSDALIVLDSVPIKPSSVIVVLNTTTDLKGKSIREIYSIRIDDSSIRSSKGDFIMTTSSYMESDKVVYSQEITKDKFCKNRADALLNPVDIYVERIVAKVAMTFTDAAKMGNPVFNVQPEFFVSDELLVSPVEMRIVVDGWKLNATNYRTNYLKNLDKSWVTNPPFEDWNTTYRSYWALDINYSGDASSYNGSTYNDLNWYSWKDARFEKDNEGNFIIPVEYCYENTVERTNQQGQPGDRANVTTMLIAAHAEFSTDKGTSWHTGEDFFRYDGVLYTLEGFKNLHLRELREQGFCLYKQEGETVTIKDLESSDIVTSIKELSVSHVMLKVDGLSAGVGYSLKQKKADDTFADTDVDALNAAIEASDLADDSECYRQGMCYYQVPIEHLSSTADARFYGVVRNHSYRLKLSNISRLGDPVYNPNLSLQYIPGKDDNYYASVKLSILKWRLIKNDMNFGDK